MAFIPSPEAVLYWSGLSLSFSLRSLFLEGPGAALSITTRSREGVSSNLQPPSFS
jgi:hypothetical protein